MLLVQWKNGIFTFTVICLLMHSLLLMLFFFVIMFSSVNLDMSTHTPWSLGYWGALKYILPLIEYYVHCWFIVTSYLWRMILHCTFTYSDIMYLTVWQARQWSILIPKAYSTVSNLHAEFCHTYEVCDQFYFWPRYKVAPFPELGQDMVPLVSRNLTCAKH